MKTASVTLHDTKELRYRRIPFFIHKVPKEDRRSFWHRWAFEVQLPNITIIHDIFFTRGSAIRSAQFLINQHLINS